MRRYVGSWPLRRGRQWPARPFAIGLSALVAAGAASLTACGTSAPATFHPAASASAAGPATPVPSGGSPSDAGLISLPFGSDVHIVMPHFTPADAAQIPAVTTAKNFLLAFLYAEYRGGTDHRWLAYTAGLARSGLRESMSEPDVTTESFRGTIRFSHMQAFADPSRPGAIDVAECFNNSRSQDTRLRTGKVIADHSPADQHYYRNTDVLVRNSSGQWHVAAVYPVVYYPRAKECKP